MFATYRFRERKICPKFSCIKLFQIRDVPTQIPRHPSHSLSKTTEKGHLHKVFVRDILTSGVPDVPGISCPKTSFLGSFFLDPGPPGPKSQKSLKKSLLGVSFLTFSGIFRDFLQTPQKTLFETFLRFWARRPRDSCKWSLGSQQEPPFDARHPGPRNSWREVLS